MSQHEGVTGSFGRVGIIGGSGLGEALSDGMSPAGTRLHEIETPFGSPSAPIVTGTWNGVPIAMLRRHGDGHRFMPSRVPYRANLWALRMLGCTHVLASGAVGSLREAIQPGDLVLVDQFIDRTDGRSRSFFESAAVHVEMADPVCATMHAWLASAAGRLPAARVHGRGTYICIEGPSFSTRAESMMHRAWGADVVGMTALPEARLCREACMAYALIGLATDYDCWRDRPGGERASLLQEIIGNLDRAVAGSVALIRAALEDVEPLRALASPAHTALDLAVWTPEDHLDSEERERVRFLRGRA